MGCARDIGLATAARHITPVDITHITHIVNRQKSAFLPHASLPASYEQNLPRPTPLVLKGKLLSSLLQAPFTPSTPSTPSTRAAKMGCSSALRLAVLECDTPQPQTRAQFGGYAGVFTALLSSAAKTLNPPQDLSSLVTITAHDVVNDLYSYPALDDVDALLLTGSRHTAFDNDPWILKLVDFTNKALQTGRIRVVGTCFGHQIIGRAVGAGVGKSDKGWEVAVTEVDLTDKGKEIFALDKMRIHQMHRDVVQDFPPDAIPLGGNAFCPVQGMYLPGKYLTVQGHPEFTNEIISEILFNRHTVGIFTDELYEDAMKRAPVPHDGVAIGKAFLKFMREG